MQEQLPVTPKLPKKRAPVRRQPSVLWSEQPSKLLHTDQTDGNTLLLVKQLQERLIYLEHEWQHLLEHLSEQEDSTEYITDEEEKN